MANKYLNLAGLERLWSAVKTKISTAVNTAKNEAISTASTDATTKTNDALASAKADTDAKLKLYSTTEEMNSAIEQKADSITSTVASTYTTKDEFNALEIGGRNLIRQSAEMSGTATNWGWKLPSTENHTIEPISEGSNIHKILFERSELTANAYTQWGYKYKKSEETVVSVDEVYTFSVWYYCDSAKTPVDHGIAVSIRECESDGNVLNKSSYILTNADIVYDKWVKITITHTVINDSLSYLEPLFYLTRNGNVSTYKPKLEKGNKATDWTPAPEDIEASLSEHTENTSNPHNVTKSQIGLGNVENKTSATIRGEITSANVTTALGYTPLNSSLKGANNGVAELDANGKVPSSQLPSYVDDVLEYTAKANFPTTGETGKIYVDKTTNLTYRWSGSAYTEISPSLALGETSSTAYRGDRGKIAYDHSQTAHNYLPLSGGTLTGRLNVITQSGEGGEILLGAANENTTENGITIDNYHGVFRVFGQPSKDGTTITGNGTSLIVDPYKKTITGGYTITGSLSGNATTATSASKLSNTTAIGSATQPVYFNANGVPVATTYTLGKSVPSDAVFTDTKVTVSNTNPTSGTWYYPAWGTATSGTSGLNANDGFRYYSLQGTASTNGQTILSIGNATATGTAGNKYGQVRLYSESSGYGVIMQKSTTSTLTHYLPDTAGIILNTGTTSVTQTLTSGTEVGKIKINGTETKLYAPTNTDTHYTSKNVVGSSTATSNTTSALTNGNVYLNSVENGAVTSSHKISGSGATTVTTDASGNIVISSTDTNTNTDTKATQTNTTTSADYRVVLSTNANDTTETNTLRKSANFTANPSTGAFYAKGYDRIDITGQTLDVNTLTLSAGSPEIMRYIEKTSGGASNITNIPVAGNPFILDVELIRWASASDYITKQTFVSVSAKSNEYVRYCTSGTWETSWTKRVFTDNNTTYSVATTSANGLMSSTDKAKLDGIATGANAYTLPTASSSTLGGVKTTSTVTSNSGYTACPIISGVPYYKDTNTTYSAGTGISLSGTTFSNSGVRSISTGSTNGTISVNTNGTSANVAVKGLGSAAYTDSTAYVGVDAGLISGGLTANGDFGVTGGLTAGSISASTINGSEYITGTVSITVSTATSSYVVTSLSSTDLGFTPSMSTRVVASIRKSGTSPSPYRFCLVPLIFNNLIYFVMSPSTGSIPADTYYIDYIIAKKN